MQLVPKSRINLLLGWPASSLLIPDKVKTASETVLEQSEISTKALSYGPDEGYQPLRQEVAVWLTSFYQPKKPIGEERITITGGASQNLACILQTFTDPIYTRNVWMVSPTYYLACRIFEDSGFAGRLRGVPEGSKGIDIDFLREKIRESEAKAQQDGNVEPKFKPARPWRRIYKHVIYAVPTFANPSGRVMTLDRRRELVQLAREMDALIVTDDVYDMLQWPASSATPLSASDKAYQPRIVDIDRELEGASDHGYGNAVSNGSFSKLIGPGCRTGWAEGTSKLAYGLSQTGSSRSGGCPSQLVATFVHQLLETGALQKHINEKLRPAYAQRYHELVHAIEDELVPLGVVPTKVEADVAGGYFIWLLLPKGLNAGTISRQAVAEENLTVAGGALFKVQGDENGSDEELERSIRLAFSWEAEDMLVEGVERLASLIRRVLNNEI